MKGGRFTPWLAPLLLGAGSPLLFFPSCGGSQQGAPGENATPDLAFREVQREAGLEWRHFNGASGKFYFPEIMGSGVALLDYDSDGDDDVYVVQGAMLDPHVSPVDSLFPPPEPGLPRNRLFRNELVQSGQLRFTDVTDEAGVGDPGYGMGVAVGDIDGDRDLDLYVTNFGPNVLYRNNGDGTFTDISQQAGVANPRWSASASFFDYDRDGRLDLFVANYVNFAVAANKTCYHAVGALDYCSPSVYEPVPDELYRNQGGGRFTRVTGQAGLDQAFGAGLGVVSLDFDSNGWPDLYVANDGTPNQLWINRGDGTFEERGLLSGTAYNQDGQAEAGMGIAASDFDRDGDPDLFVTHLARETNTLYLNDGRADFEDATGRFALASVSLPYTGFGTAWVDAENDGDLDLFVANGAVTIEERLLGEPFPYWQRNQLFRNEMGTFQEWRAPTISDFEGSQVSRGLAVADINNDGALDLMVTNNNGPVQLFLNESQQRGNWLQIRLEGAGGNRFGVGARLATIGLDCSLQWSAPASDGSYLSAHGLRVHFGLGKSSSLPGLLAVWPDGTAELWKDIEINRVVTLVQGSGEKVPVPSAAAPGQWEGCR